MHSRGCRDRHGTATRILVAALLLPVFAGVSLVLGGAALPGSGQSSQSQSSGFQVATPAETGVHYTNRLERQRVLASQILVNGSGVAAGDVDGDGWVDLYFCGLDSDNQLFRNRGSWRFENDTERTGVACAGIDCTGAAFADLDGDNDLDLVVNSVGAGTRVFLNDGTGRFTPGAEVLNPGRGGSSLALSDVDGDGDLDLYVANYRTSTFSDASSTRFTVRRIDGEFTVTHVDGRPLTHPDLTNRFTFTIKLDGGGRGRLAHDENGEVDVLYLNDGAGRFRALSFTAGAFLDSEGRPLAQPPYEWGLSAAFRDLNGDGEPDLYVCNDFRSPDRVWLGVGQGRFRAADPLTLRQIPLASMAVDFADLDRDGNDEILAVDMLSRDHQRRLTQRNMMRGDEVPVSSPASRPQYPRNALQWNRGDGTYSEVAQIAGLEASEWTWAPVFLDVDLDGYEDLLIGNGFERDNINLDAIAQIERAKAGARLTQAEFLKLRAMFPRHATPNLAFRNLEGLRFEDMSREWGFNAATIAQGICLADLDNDGDLDLAVNNLNDPAVLYRNISESARLGVRLQGFEGNTRGVGARIRVYGEGLPMQSQEMMCGGRYLSADEPLRVFAAGSATNRLRVEVDWRSGRQSVVEQVVPGQVLVVAEAAATGIRPVAEPPPEPWFEDRSAELGHMHQDELFDDFARQPLLGKRFSQLGPGVAWFDLDGDGHEDLVVTSGKSGRLAMFRNEGDGRFGPWRREIARLLPDCDQTGVVGYVQGAGRRALLVGLARYEGADTNAPAAVQLNLDEPAVAIAVTSLTASVGPLALADFNGDRRLDLLVGGRVQSGRYPEPVSSMLLRGTPDGFTPDVENSAQLRDVGMVSGAVWTDLSGDGWPELVLACEWGPVRIFRNRQGSLQPWNVPLTWPDGADFEPVLESTDRLTGWWNGVTSGDFDGDGNLDLLVSNWGLNSRYEFYGSHPLRVYYGDYDQDGILEMIEAGRDHGRAGYVPDRWLDYYGRWMPFLREQYPTHLAWAKTDMETALGPFMAGTRFSEAACRSSIVLLNRTDHFEAVPLPWEAQLSPAFAVCVADADGDGHEDAFLSQNFFAVDRGTSRYDAGRGLWLRGNGRGRFEPVPARTSGVLVFGEQRGAALADYDEDGRVDLVVSQNGGETKLYRNRHARPGLRVRLQVGGTDETVIGAAVRLRFGDRWGPRRELHAGSGYWSQDSSVVVLARPEPPDAVEVRWPGGATEVRPLVPDAREVVMTWNPAQLSDRL